MQADDSEGAPAHWQSVIRAQFTNAGYVILALSVAALGFQMVFVLNAQFDAGDPWQRAALVAALLSLLVLFLSVAMGLFLILNRVRDLRATLLAAGSGATESEIRVIEGNQRLSAKLGRRSWRLFWFHLGAFGLGVFLAAVAVMLSVIAAFLSYGEVPPGCDI